MDMYLVALYGHIVGALFLFSLLGIETMGLLRFRAAGSVEAARASMGLMGVMRKGGPIALVVILVPGLWMAADRWHFPAWTGVALLSMVVLAGIGIVVNGGVMRRLGPRIGQAQAWSDELTVAVRDVTLLRSLGLRLGLALGIVAVMVFKHELVGSLVAVIGGALIGLAASFAA